MAANESLHDGRTLNVTVPAGVLSGAPTVSSTGGLLGVALMDRDATLLTTTIDRGGVYNLSVKGLDDFGNRAVGIGDAIYYLDADTPKLSKKSSGRFFGIALQAVNSGATTTIQVLLLGNLGMGLADSGQHLMAVTTNGTTPVNVIGATIPFKMKILGVYLIALDVNAANITLAFGTAGSVVVIAKGTTAGVMVGGVTLTNTVAAAGDTLTLVSNSASGQAQAFILFQFE